MKDWREFYYCCPTCGTDLTFEGDLQEATADCPTCGTVFICPDEMLASAEAESRMDAARDDRLER
jgi:uncharacterized Zn finger protein